MERILGFLEKNGASKTSDIAAYLELSPARTRAILASMENIEIIGAKKNRKYKLK